MDLTTNVLKSTYPRNLYAMYRVLLCSVVHTNQFKNWTHYMEQPVYVLEVRAYW